MDWRECLVGMAVGKSGLDEELAEEDHDFAKLGVCLDRWSGHCSEVDDEGVMPRDQNYCCGSTNIRSPKNLASPHKLPQW